MKINLLLGLFISALMFSSCSDNDNSSTKGKDFTINVENDISKFNAQTGELTFKAGEIYEAQFSSKESLTNSVGLNSTITFKLSNSPIFESLSIHPEYSSYIEDDLVLVMKQDLKYYLLIGYPPLESLGENQAEAEQIRNKNFEKRKANWDKFINYLTEAGLINE